ncbi:hypothetical protein [Dapis sp. BLCC M229]|uniref:hypothetical protein n=1 Tax=Dapis sp. BLCC M229 TaxID=3400188 RepID=UPI003CEDF645
MSNLAKFSLSLKGSPARVMVNRDNQCLAREQDAPTAMSRNKNNYNARPLECTTTH